MSEPKCAVGWPRYKLCLLGGCPLHHPLPAPPPREPKSKGEVRRVVLDVAEKLKAKYETTPGITFDCEQCGARWRVVRAETEALRLAEEALMRVQDGKKLDTDIYVSLALASIRKALNPKGSK